MTIAFVFPGQGSQIVGMGQELAAAFPAAAEVFETIDDALGENLTNVMFEGLLNHASLTWRCFKTRFRCKMQNVVFSQLNIDVGYGNDPFPSQSKKPF